MHWKIYGALLAAVLLFILVKLLVEKWRSALLFLLTLFIGLPCLFVLVVISMPLLFVDFVLEIVLTQVFGRRRKAPGFLHRIHDKNESLLDVTLWKPIELFGKGYRSTSHSSKKSEYAEMMGRSLFGLKKYKSRIEVIANWDSSLKEDQVTVDVFRRGKGDGERVNIWFLEAGIKTALEERFVSEKRNGVPLQAFLWNKGKGEVVCNDDKIELDFLNVRCYRTNERSRSVPFSLQTLRINEKDAKRSQVIAHAYYDGSKLKGFNFQLVVEYGDDLSVPRELIEQLKGDMKQTAVKEVNEYKRRHENQYTKVMVEKCFIRLEKDKEHNYHMEHTGTFLIEATERSTEVLFETKQAASVRR